LEVFNNFWAETVDLVWGPWLVILLILSGVYFTVAGRFLPFRAIGHAISILRGKYDRKDDPGEISHFQALSSALSATIGMGNIAGVAIAISVGGPGAVFWMWVAGLVGMSTKFFTCTLATMYRKKDELGVDQGGPMYYLEVGLGPWFKPLAIMFALCGMIGCLSLFQVNQLAELIKADYKIDNLITGTVSMLLVGIVILGGITRVGKVASKVVPAMFLLYFFSALVIIASNIAVIPGLLLSIITSAFGGKAVVGGVTGIAFTRVLVTGVRRAAFSNEAGLGTAPMAHGAAKTKEPVREGLIAMLGPFLDTNIVCTLTALVILSSGVLTGELQSDAEGVLVTVNAFTAAMGAVGRYILTVVIVLFSISTMISYSYYGLKCAKYLFGIRVGELYIYLYLLSLPAAAWLDPGTVVNIVDTWFALMAVPTLTGALLLSPKVVSALKEYLERMKRQQSQLPG
jgi:AGCS family alanine or glycine:cation symporter